jgi:hypothetical protein
MKVWIGGYRGHWTTQRMDKAWAKFHHGKEDWEVKRSELDAWDAAYETFAETIRFLFCRPRNWIANKIPRISYIKIDHYDTWSADSTLAPIILPMMIQLREKQHGAPFTEDADVPEHLRSTSAPPKENEYDTDAFHFERWDWIMGEIIFAFEQLVKEDMGEDQFRTGFADIHFQAFDKNGDKVGESYPLGEKPKDVEENENVSHYQIVNGPRYTMVTDFEGLKKHNARIKNGLRLFGTYYQGLWD